MHNDIWYEKSIKVNDNNPDINKSNKDFNDYKENLLNFLYHNPLTGSFSFALYALKLLIKSELKFEIKNI